VIVLGRRAITDWSTLAIFLVALVLVLRVRRLPEPVLLLAAAAIGIVMHRAPL
jgi:chromate transporter